MHERRHERLDYRAPALLLAKPTLRKPRVRISRFHDISQGGACIIAPPSSGIRLGTRIALLTATGAPARHGIIVGLSPLGLHCCLTEAEQLTEAELAGEGFQTQNPPSEPTQDMHDDDKEILSELKNVINKKFDELLK